MNDQVMEILRILAEKFGTTTEFLWGVMLKQAYVHGITAIICYILSLLCIFGWNWGVWRFKIPEEDNGDARFVTYIVRFFGGVLAFIWIGSFISGMLEVTTALINPEYWAIKQVLGGLK